MEWKAILFLNPSKKNAKRTFNFRSIKNPEHVKELVQFKSDLVKIVKNIQFRKVNSKFQNKLHHDKLRIQRNF